MILSVFDERSKPAFAFIFFSKGGRLVGKYIAKRILSGVITIVILITACFFLMHAIPGSPFAKGEQGVPEAVMQRLNEKYGLDQPLYKQYFTYLNHVYADAGGVYLYEKHVGDSVEHYRSVPRERQVRALEFLLGQLDDMEWLDDRSVTGNLGLVASAADAVCEAVMKAVVASPSKVGLSAALAENDAFTPEACMSLIYDRIWAPTLRRKALNLSQIKRQRLFLETLGKVAALREEGNSKSLAAMRRMEVPEAFRTDRSLLPNASAGCPGPVAGYDDPMPLFYEERPMEGLAYDCVLKIRRLLEGQRNHPDPQTRLHYRSLLHTIESYLK